MPDINSLFDVVKQCYQTQILKPFLKNAKNTKCKNVKIWSHCFCWPSSIDLNDSGTAETEKSFPDSTEKFRYFLAFSPSFCLFFEFKAKILLISSQNYAFVSKLYTKFEKIIQNEVAIQRRTSFRKAPN